MKTSYILIIISIIIIVSIIIINLKESNTTYSNNTKILELPITMYEDSFVINIDHVKTISRGVKFENSKPVFYDAISQISGTFAIDSGSHLLFKPVNYGKEDIEKILRDNNVSYKDQEKTHYSIGQGGGTPLSIEKDIVINKIKYRDFPFNFMPLKLVKEYKCKHPMINYSKNVSCDLMSLESPKTDGLAGIAYFKKNNPLYKYCFLYKLFKQVNNNTLLLDIKNEKIILGLDKPPKGHTFDSKLQNNKDGYIEWEVAINKKPGEENVILIDTGTAKTFITNSDTKPIKFTGVENISKGVLNINKSFDFQKQNIIGCDNITTWGWIFVDYDKLHIYVKQ